MKAIILAAGYATRLYPLTENVPKALLNVGSKAILDHIIENVLQIPVVDGVYIVTNEKFYQHFQDWKDDSSYSIPITIYNDGTTNNENRLGALGDLKFVLDKGKISEEIIVLAGDNLMDFSLNDLYNFYKEVDNCCVCVKEIKPHEVPKMAIVLTDETNRVTDFEEKPKNPKSLLGAFAVYIYKKETLPLLDEYLQTGNNPDSPGNFPAWLYKRVPVYAYEFDGNCYDIGTHDAYAEVQELYKDK
ncbi:MAG: nucleotidyltransferase family protein [Clostridiales bacterium]|nr:nucleotidyltransferase family protein [Clostridiales bacterium]